MGVKAPVQSLIRFIVIKEELVNLNRPLSSENRADIKLICENEGILEWKRLFYNKRRQTTKKFCFGDMLGCSLLT